MFEYTLEMFEKDVEALELQILSKEFEYAGIYGILQGGVPLAIILANKLNLPLVSDEDLWEYTPGELPILVVDDLVDSGKTLEEYEGFDIAVLGHKGLVAISTDITFYCARVFPKEWIHFWWEPRNRSQDPEKMVTRLLEYIGENPVREGLQETPKRVIKSFKRLYDGYSKNPEDIMKTFSEDKCDEMVILKDITLHSTCEHHMLPFSGLAHIGYIPNGKVIGVSKLARLLEIFARRLQIQERIGEQVTGALMEHLKPLGAVCVIEARHYCMTARGVEQQTTKMITSSVKGVFKDLPEARAEFMGLIK